MPSAIRRTASGISFFARDFFDQRPGTALAMVKLGDDMITPAGPETTVLRAFADWQIYERNRTLYDRHWDAWHTSKGHLSSRIKNIIVFTPAETGRPRATASVARFPTRSRDPIRTSTARTPPG